MANFKFLPKAEFTAKVEVSVPADILGEPPQTFQVTVRYKRLDQAEVKELIRRELQAMGLGAEAAASFRETVLRENIVGWSGMPGTEGDVPFSAEALEEALKIRCYVECFHGKFMEDIRNPTGAARKN